MSTKPSLQENERREVSPSLENPIVREGWWGGVGAMKRILVLLISILSLVVLPAGVHASGFCLYPMGGYQFYVGGNQGSLDGAPVVGTRIEYNFSGSDVSALGLVYLYSSHHYQDYPDRFSLEQHFCLLGYRFAYNWTWVSTGSHIGTGAVVREEVGSSQGGVDAQYALQIGIQVSFRPFRWMEIGPDFSWMLSTNMDKWIFGGDSTYFVNLGGHIGIYF